MMILAAFAVVAVTIVCLEGWGRLAVAGVARWTGEQPKWDLPGVRGRDRDRRARQHHRFLRLGAGAGPGAVLDPHRGGACRLGGAAASRRAAGASGAGASRPGSGSSSRLGAWLVIWGLADPSFQPCDDNVAYFPFAHELFQVGGLHEPFSQRRIGTLGSWIPIEFWGYKTLGPVGAAARRRRDLSACSPRWRSCGRTGAGRGSRSGAPGRWWRRWPRSAAPTWARTGSRC